MYFEFLQTPCYFGYDPPSKNKVEFFERQFHSEKLSFVRKQETEHSFELPLSICVFYLLNSSLENHHMMNARQPFC